MNKIILIVGLGNPGAEYIDNRHNVGFQMLDAIAETIGSASFRKMSSEVETFSFVLGKTKIILAKPQTFMNNSGRAVRFLMDFYKISVDDVYVFHDDIDLPFGRVRIKQGGGNGGHNGLKSIDNCCGKDYWRIRIGVGRPEFKTEVVSYVLGNFTKEQKNKLEEIFSIVAKNIPLILSDPQKLVAEINQ